MFVPETPCFPFLTLFTIRNQAANVDMLRRLFHAPVFIVFSKGRDAIDYGMGALNVMEDSRVWLPAYLCSSVFMPVHRRCPQVLFYDVDQRLVPRLNEMSVRKNDVFLMVHYFGLAQPVEMIKKYCTENGMFLFEDCAHSLPDLSSSVRVGSYGDLSVFSLRKQLCVPDGAVLEVNNPNIVVDTRRAKVSPVFALSKRKMIQMGLEALAFKSGVNILMLKKLLKDKMLPGIPLPEEQMHEVEKESRISSITLRVLETADISAIIEKRKKNFDVLVSLLNHLKGVSVPFKTLTPGSVPKVFPVFVEYRDAVCKYLWSQGVEATLWPGVEQLREADWKQFPGAREWVSKSLFLPVHENLSQNHLEAITKALSKGLKKISLKAEGASVS